MFIKSTLKTGKIPGVLYWFFLIIIVIQILRDFCFSFPEWISFLMGIAPNFLAVPLLMEFGRKLVLEYLKRINNVYAIAIICFLFSILGLSLWEYVRFLGGFPFDTNDIWASVFGGVLYFPFFIMLSRRWKNEEILK